MKKFIEILEEIKKTGEAIRAAEANEKMLVDSFVKLEDIKSSIAKKKAVENEMIENSENIKNLKIIMKILKNNARVALFYDVLPVALEILAKYSGKPYGEKTRQKISDEVKEKTNCRFYIGSRYGSHSFEVYGVTICTGYRNMPGARLEGIREYEEKAAAIWSWENKTPFEEKQRQVEKLLQEFCLKNGGRVYA